MVEAREQTVLATGISGSKDNTPGGVKNIPLKLRHQREID
jgi:hypothetical protein